MISSASRSELVNGFSQTACRPAASASITIGWCIEGGVQMLTTSIPGARRQSLRLRNVRAMPNRAANALARPSSRSQHATTRNSAGRCAKPFSICRPATQPQPIIATFNGDGCTPATLLRETSDARTNAGHHGGTSILVGAGQGR